MADDKFEDFGSISPIPENRVLGPAARGLAALKRGLGHVPLPEVLGGDLGNLVVGSAPEEVDKWAHGFSPFYDQSGGFNPTLRPDRYQGVLDAALLPVGEAAGLTKLASRAVPGVRKAVSEGIGHILPKDFNAYHGSPNIFEPTPSNPLGEFDPSRSGTNAGTLKGAGTYLSGGKGGASTYARGEGGFYTVKVPKSLRDSMLHLNQPLYKQSESITSALINTAKDIGLDKSSLDFFSRYTDKGVERATNAENLYSGLELELLKRKIAGTGKKPTSAQYKEVQMELAAALRKNGIPGVKYKDVGSSSTNYLVFPGEESKLNIVNRKAKGGSIENTTHYGKLI